MVVTPQTLFTGQQLLWLPACASTNTEAQALIVQNRASDGCTVITDFQTAGRGQRGNQWEAAPAENLMLSVVWQPTFLAAAQQFLLSQAVALGLHDWASALLGASPKLKLKWPNDLYYGDQKLGGVLIENSLSGTKIQHSVIGIGLNINQQQFALPTATSLSQLTGRAYAREVLAARLLECLERRYLQLRAGQVGQLRQAYLQALYRYQETHLFLVEGRQVSGQIVGVEEDGRLAVAVGNELRRFGMQEIRHL
ncbi:biotin--[acetyl-CoA-carboxylase] ligase [Hymenobacter lapidarius]|uniref:Biotin--[acetyl-CoA-carboxylase] ligase n=1 Tax=Hymenobacter lapidarius TaxID=1908237 RepID=A0A1G1T595_9BACT|nr:biotin--[acetyl-CoA-carboxylase] ligase [Hymenobacter lapidarius]OGX86042.1 biotin--[acetyl-CoA-carboxylase] ligase [Hymenobacter lapidarius]